MSLESLIFGFSIIVAVFVIFQAISLIKNHSLAKFKSDDLSNLLRSGGEIYGTIYMFYFMYHQAAYVLITRHSSWSEYLKFDSDLVPSILCRTIEKVCPIQEDLFIFLIIGGLFIIYDCWKSLQKIYYSTVSY